MLKCNFSALAAEPTLHTQMNFVLNLKSYYADSLESVFEDLAVEKNIDRMFYVEAVWITKNTLSSYDYQKIQEFKNSISFQDRSYNINIP